MDEEHIREVARMCHRVECKSNHTNGCSWYYESWEVLNETSTRGKYIKKAKALPSRNRFEVLQDVLVLINENKTFIWSDHEK